jgi:hypothetical protein
VQPLDADGKCRNPAHDEKCNDDDQQEQIVEGHANVSRDQLVARQRTVGQMQAENHEGRQHADGHGNRPEDNPKHHRKPKLAPVDAAAETEQQM